VEYRTVTYRHPDGTAVEAFVALPPTFQEGTRYLLMLMVHGGPHGAYGHSFDHEPQYYAASGRIVLMVNPWGSSGYGQRFAAACVNDWGVARTKTSWPGSMPSSSADGWTPGG
jgi:dipeptidyl aminopeptidase/acylaminoacyl peptidase